MIWSLPSRTDVCAARRPSCVHGYLIYALGSENSWAVTDTCTKCGLTHEQIVTLSGQEKSSASFHETVMISSSR